MDCTIWRKRLLRAGPSGDEVGGIPNIGGLGVLDGEDEAEYEYDFVGDGKILFSAVWQGQGANWNDTDSGVIYDQAPREAQIEFVEEVNDFVRKSDRVSVEPGGGIVLIYEVLGESSPINIPPYVRRYLLAARSDEEAGVG